MLNLARQNVILKLRGVYNLFPHLFLFLFLMSIINKSFFNSLLLGSERIPRGSANYLGSNRILQGLAAWPPLPRTTVCSQNINKQIVNISDENLTNSSFLNRYHYTESKINLKDNIEFVTEFPCLLGHPVWYIMFHVYWDTLYDTLCFMLCQQSLIGSKSLFDY